MPCCTVSAAWGGWGPGGGAACGGCWGRGGRGRSEFSATPQVPGLALGRGGSALGPAMPPAEPRPCCIAPRLQALLPAQPSAPGGNGDPSPWGGRWSMGGGRGQVGSRREVSALSLSGSEARLPWPAPGPVSAFPAHTLSSENRQGRVFESPAGGGAHGTKPRGIGCSGAEGTPVPGPAVPAQTCPEGS